MDWLYRIIHYIELYIISISSYLLVSESIIIMPAKQAYNSQFPYLETGHFFCNGGSIWCGVNIPGTHWLPCCLYTWAQTQSCAALHVLPTNAEQLKHQKQIHAFFAAIWGEQQHFGSFVTSQCVLCALTIQDDFLLFFTNRKILQGL